MSSFKIYSIQVDLFFFLQKSLPMKRLISFEILFPHKFHLYIPVEHTKGAILLCTENVRFNFERNAFEEIDLLVMDRLLVPTLADVF